jgi:hypothetical protein
MDVGTTSLVNTVSENKARYTHSDYLRAVHSRTMKRRIGNPSIAKYIDLITKGQLPNCNVTRQDIVNAEDIFGPDTWSLQGKTVRRRSDQVRSGGLVPIPAMIMETYRKVVLGIDVMQINKMNFFVTIGSAIKFGTVCWLRTQTGRAILKAITSVHQLYVKRGFLIEVINADGQFETLRGPLRTMGITLNRCSREEHVPAVERRIRTLKERCRCLCNALPFPKLPAVLLSQMVSTCNFWLNNFPPTDGVTQNLSPREIITGLKIDCNKHVRAEFGEYVHVHEEHDNTMATRTAGAIATQPTGNAQGGHYFYSLNTGRMIDRQNWTPLPMPADVIARVTVLAKTAPVGMNFATMRNMVFVDDDPNESDSDDDSNYDDSSSSDDEDDEEDDDEDNDAFIEGVDNPRQLDPPTANDEDVDETSGAATDDDSDEYVDEISSDGDNDGDDDTPPNSDEDDNSQEWEEPSIDNNDEPQEREIITDPELRKLADSSTGALPMIMQSRTRPQENRETSLLTGALEEWEKVEKSPRQERKFRKFQKKLATQILARSEAEKHKRKRNKASNDKKRLRAKRKKTELQLTRQSESKKELQLKVQLEIPKSSLPEVETVEEDSENKEKDQYGDLRDKLRSQQRQGGSFPDDSCSTKDLTSELEAIALTQYTLQRGLKEFGQDGVSALGKEMEQLHVRKVAKPVDSNSLSKDQKKAALRYLMFLTKKRCGRIKARGCADGRKQRETTKKEDAAAPTVAIESVMLSATIDAMEERDVATVDIPGAFMQADIDEVVHIRFEGKIAEMLVKMDPKMYRKYVKDENGKSVLYVELLKALYGTMRAALLFWQLLSSKLESWGFVINPYDWCVANKMINGKQCTILWHVDDLKISHVDEDVVTGVIEKITDQFGKEAPLTVTRGKVHDYLGMTLDYSVKGKVMIKMLDYAEKMLADLPEEMNGVAPTPAANHLFEVDESQTKVDEKRAQFFHTYVAKALFLCKRARPDLQTAVAFLCTRVKSCDEDDYKKLKRMLQFLRSTKDDYLTLSANSLHNVRWWVDASYAVHPDMRSHTGGALSLGRGVIYGTSRRQRLNTKSSTESELVGADDVLPQMLWTLYFLEAQGYKIDDNILYQDNKSSILLETNGRGSSGKRTRHINVRYFFIKDRVESKEIRIEYCPTGIMVADYFTKPLQGVVFRTLRDMIMGNSDIPLPSKTDSTTVKENGVPTTPPKQEPRSVLGLGTDRLSDIEIIDAGHTVRWGKGTKNGRDVGPLRETHVSSNEGLNWPMK